MRLFSNCLGTPNKLGTNTAKALTSYKLSLSAGLFSSTRQIRDNSTYYRKYGDRNEKPSRVKGCRHGTATLAHGRIRQPISCDRNRPGSGNRRPTHRQHAPTRGHGGMDATVSVSTTDTIALTAVKGSGAELPKRSSSLGKKKPGRGCPRPGRCNVSPWSRQANVRLYPRSSRSCRSSIRPSPTPSSVIVTAV